MKKLVLMGLSVAACCTTACETDIEVPEPEHTPSVAALLSVDTRPVADSVIRDYFPERNAFVSVSRRLYDVRPRSDEGRADATIEVRDASGTVVERYRHRPNLGSQSGNYRPTLRYRYQPGQEYQLRVAVPGVEAAESRLTLPAQVPVEATFTPLTSTNPNSQRGRLTVSFTDPGATADYYEVTAHLLDARGRLLSDVQVEDNGNGTVDLATYRLSQTSWPSGRYPFTDTNVNGQRISFSNDIEYYNSGGSRRPAYLEVTLSHHTRELYLFVQSQRLYYENDGNPFAEPTPLYSNIKPGFGIFGGSADAVYRIAL